MTDGTAPERQEGDDTQNETGTDPIPDAVQSEAERLSRLARQAADDAEREAYRDDRADLLGDYEYTARVREDETRDVLVLHPEEWVEDGTIRPTRVEDVDRGVEIPLSGPGEADDWELVDEHNRELVREVSEAYGEVHGANAAALADFAGNHYAKPIENVTADELEAFLTEYYPRNAWPTDEQRDVVEKSIAFVFEVAAEPNPLER